MVGLIQPVYQCSGGRGGWCGGFHTTRQKAMECCGILQPPPLVELYEHPQWNGLVLTHRGATEACGLFDNVEASSPATDNVEAFLDPLIAWQCWEEVGTSSANAAAVEPEPLTLEELEALNPPVVNSGGYDDWPLG